MIPEDEEQPEFFDPEDEEIDPRDLPENAKYYAWQDRIAQWLIDDETALFSDGTECLEEYDNDSAAD